MLLSVFITRLACQSIRFLAFYDDEQGLKSLNQIEEPYKIVKESFAMVSRNSLTDNWNKNIFMLKNGKDTVAYIQINLDFCYLEPPKRTRYAPFMTLYCVTVAPKYKGSGMSYRIMRESIRAMQKHYSLSGDTIISLHLDCKDKDMFIALKTYYKLGFTKGNFCRLGPLDFQYRINRLFDNAKDLYAIADNPEISSLPGNYIMSYCRLKDFGKDYKAPKDAVEKGKALMRILKGRSGIIKEDIVQSEETK